MSTTFTPSADINMTKEKEWSSGLGMLDWDDANIVFTKRSLIEFLKYTGTTVDTNFANIHKLPRYAKIGSFSPPLSAELASATTSAVTSPVVDNDSDAFKPTRRVRTVPGGPHTDIFGEDFQGEEDALSRAPPKHTVQAADTTAVDEPKVEQDEEEQVGIQFSSNVKPSRRVRTEPGGKSSVGSLWDTDAPPEEFKPTRRVREGPGGQDNLNNLW